MEFKVREIRYVEYELETRLAADDADKAIDLFEETPPSVADEVDRSLTGGVNRLVSVEVLLLDMKDNLVAKKVISIWQK